MAEVTFNVASATPRKRSHDGNAVDLDETAVSRSVIKCSIAHITSSRQGSPAPSTASSLTDLTSTNDAPGSAVKSSASDSKPSKKRKLGFIEAQAEKAAKQREKDEKARQKAEEKARKDDEKRLAAEEKEKVRREKDLEKAEKQKVKDEEKQKKEAEKALKDAQKAQKEAEKRAKDAEKEAEKNKKEAEKLKKERTQMRLGAFFAKPKTEDTPPSTPEDVSDGASSRRSSIASIDVERPALQAKKLNQATNPDYENCFLPFFVPDHTDVAPTNRFKLSRRVDFEVTPDSETTVCDVRECFGRPRKRMRKTVQVRDVIRNMQATGLDLIDLDSEALDALGSTTYKCLQFREDIRPPYQGTFTRAVSPGRGRKISRNPFTRSLPRVNYDYDSEAEWEPPGEDDEELGDDDEMSDAEDAADDMADFLDDAEDIARRKGPLSDMNPVSSGLCWVGEVFDDHGTNLEQYRMDFLHDSTTLPIDPFSKKHWIDGTKQKTIVKQESSTSTMQPPRQPLSSLSPNAIPAIKNEIGVDGKPLPANSKKTISDKPLKIIPSETMDDFKKAIMGSDLTKAGLIEILKKQFPKCSKDTIKDTLGVVAKRVGPSEKEKRWRIVDSA